jgi:hypothetical protein
MDRADRYALGSDPSLPAMRQSDRLAVLHVVFLPSAVAFAASTFRPDKDLQDDKEGCATGVMWKCDINAVELIVSHLR